jgi:hypothetical protein
MPFLRQSTAQVIRFGPCLDITDGVTEEVSLTLVQGDMRLSKDGAAFAQKGTAGNATHDSDGWYSTTLSTADTNTVGELRLNVHQPANMLPLWDRWWVIEEAIYDAFFGAGALGFLLPTVAGRSLDVTAAGEAGLDFGNVVGVLGQANVGWVDANSRVDLGQVLGTAQSAGDIMGSLGEENAGAADGDPSTTESLMQYAKQIINTLEGAAGIPVFPTGVDPANNVSLAEAIRAIRDDVTALNGQAMRGTDSAALASVVGALNDAAAVGDPTAVDTIMQYAKQLINVLVGADGIGVFPAEQPPGNGINLAEVIRAMHADVTGLNGDAMRGTESAALAANYTAGRAGNLDNLDASVAAIDTAPMRGTDSAALASVLGALTDVAAAGDPTSADTIMQYLKQVINTLEGAVGIPVYPAAVDPGNNVSIAEVLRAIRDDVTALNGEAMRGTDNASTHGDPDPSNFLDVSVASRATPAQVATEISDAFAVDTISLPGQEAPPLTPTRDEMSAWLYKVFRNRTETDSDEFRLYADNESTVDAKAVVSDSGTLARVAEVVSGP